MQQAEKGFVTLGKHCFGYTPLSTKKAGQVDLRLDLQDPDEADEAHLEVLLFTDESWCVCMCVCVCVCVCERERERERERELVHFDSFLSSIPSLSLVCGKNAYIENARKVLGKSEPLFVGWRLGCTS